MGDKLSFDPPKAPKKPQTTHERLFELGLNPYSRTKSSTPFADVVSGFTPEEEAREQEERDRADWMADKLKRDVGTDAMRLYGEDIAARMSQMLADAWARKVMHYWPIKTPGPARKALNVEAFAFANDGAAIDVLRDVREFIAPEFQTLTTQDVDSEDLVAKMLPRTTERIALLARVDLETKENTRVAKLFDRCCEKTGQTVTAHCLTAKSFFDAIAMVERTGSAASFITVHREDAQEFICDLQGYRQESDKTRRGLGYVGKFDGIDVVVPTLVVDNVVKRGCAYVTVAPIAIGGFEEAVSYSFVPYSQLVEPTEPDPASAKKPLGWTVTGLHRLYANNPYGVARIDFGKESTRRM